MSELEVLARTLFLHDADGALVRDNEDGGARAPRVFLAWNDHAVHCALRDDVSADTGARIRAAVAAQPPTGDLAAPPACAADLRAALGPIASEDGQLQYGFPARIAELGPTVAVTASNAHLIERWLPGWRAYALEPWPAIVSLVDGHAVAICATVRTPTTTTQAGVETHPSFRRQGHAAATAAWALAIRALGIEPRYGTSWTNTGSQRVAARLGLTAYAGSLTLT